MNTMNIKNLSIEDIKPYEKNPRDNKNAIQEVAKSLEAYGWQQPIVVDKNNIIIVGHTRYEAAKRLGMKEVPVVVADNLSEAQVKAYRIADNKTSDFSIWDNKLLLEELGEIEEGLYTGFVMGDVFGEDIDESDNEVLEGNEYGVTYGITFKSQDKEKVIRVNEFIKSLELDFDE